MINLYTNFGGFANNLLDLINIQYILNICPPFNGNGEILFFFETVGIAIIVVGIILLSTGKKAVDVAHKIITGVATATVVTKFLFGSDDSSNKDEDKNKQDKNKQENKQASDKNETNNK